MHIAVVGSGYVGLVTGACLAHLGHHVVCMDKDETRIAALKTGRAPIYEPGLDELIQQNTINGRLSFSTELRNAVASADVVYIAVGTPALSDGAADLRFLQSAASDIARCVEGFTVIVTKSTVPVGTNTGTKEIIRRLNPTADVAVVSNPEFLREGAAIEDFLKPDRIVLGLEDERARSVMEELYLPIGKNVPIFYTSYRNAELIKYASNAFLALKIAFINEIADLCEVVDGDVTDVALGMGLDQRVGPRFLAAGPGFGGSCFPKDTLALAATARAAGLPLALVEATIVSNDKRKLALAQKVQHALGDDLSGKKIAVLGLTFKANTDDIREAPALSVVPALLGMGAQVFVHDPKAIPSAHAQLAGARQCLTFEEALTDAEACVVLTEWDEYRRIDAPKFKDLMQKPIILDFRNLYSDSTFSEVGVKLLGVGRAPPFGVDFKDERAVSVA